MPEEKREEAAAAYMLGTELLDLIVKKTGNREVALNAVLNVLGQIIVKGYEDPNKVADFVTSSLLKLVAVRHAQNIDAGATH
jgi:hypothetical protein